MNSKSLEFSVGIFVLVGLAAIAYLAIKIGGGQFFAGESRKIEAHFDNIGGLNEGSNIMIAGVKIGTVGKIDLDQENLRAIVDLNINPNYAEIEIFSDAIASIKTNGLIGDKYISLDPGGSMIPLGEDEAIVDTQSALDIESLISRFAFGSVEE
ncbi:MAG: outer membrane lipid asymmetry maintenance protein MlaD [Verrucomicrobiota bacterium]